MFEAPQAFLEGVGRVVDLGPGRLDQRHLELQARVEAAADLGLGAAQQLDQAQQLAPGELAGLPAQAIKELLVDLEVLRERDQRGAIVGDVLKFTRNTWRRWRSRSWMNCG